MRILVYPHDLGIGGSQLNAIEIGHEISRLGHEVMMYGRPGPLTERIAQLGLEFIESPDPGRRPGRAVVRDLSRHIAERGIDIAHGYEWPPGLECYLACRESPRASAVTTVMSMAVAPFLPRTMPLTVGTEQIAALERSRGRRRVSVVEPPVDTVRNRPGSAPDMAAFRSAWGLDDGLPTIVCVTRLARQLKFEGLLIAIDTIHVLHPDLPTRLLIVGDGEARAEVEHHASRVNRALGYRAIVLTGEVTDPRAAYDLADVCLAMGGSALRSMAFAKPLVVQGEGGFFRVLTPSSLDDFLWTGWFGHGGRTADPVEDLRALLLGLLADPALGRRLGGFGRTVVEDRFSLTTAAARQLDVYESALRHSDHSKTELRDEITSGSRFVGYHLRRRTARALGSGASDDFNARPVASCGRTRIAPTTPDGALLYFPGVSWDAVVGTDRSLATAVAQSRPVVWIDPPMSGVSRRRRGITVPPISVVAPGITRVSTTCPPGVTRPVLRHIAHWLTARHARRVITDTGTRVWAVIVSSPEHLVPTWAGDAVKIYYETDDFVAGASLMGLDAGQVQRVRATNIERSDVVLGVTALLTEHLATGQTQSATLANGTDVDHFAAVGLVAPAPGVHLDRPIAGIIGQLNDRLDVTLLEAVVDEGVSLLLVGPRLQGVGRTCAQLDALIARPQVQWIDRQPFERLPSYLSLIGVGLTPYAMTEFNRASFPLKTLEYLAAGLPVVSTDLPSARGLDNELVHLATTPSEFAEAVRSVLEQPTSPYAQQRRRAFAGQHSWAARARQFETIVASARQRGLFS